MEEEDAVSEIVDGDQEVSLLRTTMTVSTGDGVPLAVLRKSPLSGQPRGRVLLIPGLRGTRHNFDLPSRSFANFLVGKGYEVFLAELRGSGESRRLGAPQPRGIAVLLDQDLPALLAATFQGDQSLPLFVAGHSLGGLLACLAAGRHPDKINAVVAYAPAFALEEGTPLLRAASRSWVALTSTKVGAQLSASRAVDAMLTTGRHLLDLWPLRPNVRTIWPGSMEKEVARQFRERQRKEPAFVGLLRDLSRMALGDDPEGLDLAATLRQMRAPLLVLVGDRDELAPPAAAEPLVDIVASSHTTMEVKAPPGGHFGHADLLLGGSAKDVVWDRTCQWLEQV